MTPKKLWQWLAGVIITSFAVLIFYGVDIYRKIPPIPDKVLTTEGIIVAKGQDIKDGQNVWQSIGGQTVGSIWGHGAYIAPDWSADFLHRESLLLLEELTRKDGKVFKNLPDEEQAKYKFLLKKELRRNTLDKHTNTIVISPERAKVWQQLADYYAKIFMNAPEMNQLRNHYAIPKNTVKDVDRMAKMNAFFAWTAWVCITERPGDDVTYTNNWPHDESIGNIPPPSLHLWSGFSILMLLACVGLLVFYHARNKDEEISEVLPSEDPLRNMKPTPSMKATLKYIWVVALLILIQMLAGVITAHYGVEGSALRNSSRRDSSSVNFP
ncbi:hypothetical protein ACFFJX_11240 [Pseudarcicella hirudinis]|uniref:hypothetical protein n=1 Tax=Pseudarcicella hirudinis TaxID=1079859 RepID=UPI0035E747F6